MGKGMVRRTSFRGRFACVLALAGLLAGCATSHVLVGTRRAPIAPEQVRLYLDPPASFEKVALLESSSEGAIAITSQGKTNAVVARLKKEAASLGANGILLTSMGGATRGAVVTGTGSTYGSSFVGTGVAVPVLVKEGTAIAIYVEPGSGVAPAAIPAATPSGQVQSGSQDCEACGRILKGGKP